MNNNKTKIESHDSNREMIQWQLKVILQQLDQIQLHASDSTCPCRLRDIGEYCLSKHCNLLSSLAGETAPMSQEIYEVMFDLAEEANDMHVKTKDHVCSKGEDIDIVTWARSWRKKIEPLYFNCNNKNGKLKDAELADPAPVQIAGKCANNSCNFTVKATEITKGTTNQVKNLGPLINEIGRRADEKSKTKVIAGKTAISSNKTFAMGITTANRYEFEWRVVDGKDLIVSHDPFTFEPNKKYVQEIQPRLRERAATQQQVLNIAKNLSPDLLITDFLSLEKGAPIVGTDLLVECGNGRVMGLLRAAKDHPDKFTAYKAKMREMAESFGLSAAQVDKMQTPVLVRVRLTKTDRKAFAQECNASTTIQSSAIENARTDAEKITPEMLNGLDVIEGEQIEDALRAIRNKPFVTALLNKLPTNDQARLVDSKGILSQEGVRRIAMAVFVATFKGDVGIRLAEKFYESTDPDVRNVFGGILRSLALLARAETLITAGQREREYTFGEDLAKVISVYSGIKKMPQYTVEKYLAQMALEARELNPFQERVLVILDKYARSAKRIGQILSYYAQGVIDSPPPGQSGFFAGAKLTKSELFEGSIKKALNAFVEDIAKLMSPMTKKQYAEAMKYQMPLIPSAKSIIEACPTCKISAQPAKKKFELFQFQKEGVAWLKGRKFALLADEQGLGKTPQGIHWGSDFLPVLVVLPAALLFNWQREISEMWRLGDKAIILDGVQRVSKNLPEWTILSYGMVNSYLPELKAAGFKAVIVDEAHNIKNLDAQRTKNMLELIEPADPKPSDRPIECRLAITGTPILNRPIEIFPLMVFLGVKKKSQYNDFLSTYTESKKIKGRTVFTGTRNLGQLNTLIKTFMIRRLKNDVLKQLPPKIYTPLFVPITNADEYKAAERNFLHWLAETKGTEAAHRAANAEIIMRMNALRQLAAKGKVQAIADWLKPCSDGQGKVIIFSQFKEPLQELAKMKGQSLIYTGEVPAVERQAMVDKFQKGSDICYFMGTTGAAGVGITLTAANRVVFLDLPWTPGGKYQAEDRAHRIGQTKQVEIVNVLAKGTIDERMLQLLNDKEFIISQAIDGKSKDQAISTSITNDLLNSFIHAPNLSDSVMQYPKGEMEDINPKLLGVVSGLLQAVASAL